MTNFVLNQTIFFMKQLLHKTLVKIALAFMLLLSLTEMQAQTMIAAWDFQTTTTGGTAVLAAPNCPPVLNANFGSGTIYLNGTNTASTWVTATSGNEVGAFGGSNLNTTGGLSTSTSGASCLALLGGVSGTASNGKFMVFKLNMTGY